MSFGHCRHTYIYNGLSVDFRYLVSLIHHLMSLFHVILLNVDKIVTFVSPCMVPVSSTDILTTGAFVFMKMMVNEPMFYYML